MIVQRGLEQIRTLKNQGMHPKLVIHLATNFGQKVKHFSHSAVPRYTHTLLVFLSNVEIIICSWVFHFYVKVWIQQRIHLNFMILLIKISDMLAV